MSEMIERVARAVRAQITGMPEDKRPILGDGEDYVGLYTDIARAAIAAMREPTDAMVSSGEAATREGWQAMIDEALK